MQCPPGLRNCNDYKAANSALQNVQNNNEAAARVALKVRGERGKGSEEAVTPRLLRWHLSEDQRHAKGLISGGAKS